MRALSLILAFTFLLGGVSMAGSTDNLPNIGLFAYSGTPVAFEQPLVLVGQR